MIVVLDEPGKGAGFAGVPVVGVAGLAGLSWDTILITTLEELEGVEWRLAVGGVPMKKVWRL